MTDRQNLRVLLASRPVGWPDVSNFRIEESAVPVPADGQVLVRSHFLSLDPYMRGRMNEGRSYVKPVELGAVMCGEVVGEVLESRHAAFAAGDLVHGDLGWQEYGIADGKLLRKLDPRVPPSANLSVAGMPGITAYVGLLDLGQAKPGETVVVSGAAGAVGSVVGQLAKIQGCRAVGIAGGAEKCRIVVEEFGFDACLDYKSGDLRDALKGATPNGVDVYFDNVGGEILDTVLARMNVFGRVPVCGLISQYNATEPYGVKNFRSILVNRLSVRGFIIFDHRDRWQHAGAQLAGWLSEGRIRYRETVAQGLRAAPAAFIGMLRGDNVGKQLVRVAG
jgi:NADPH-dependent curcumin reductase CurA